MFRMRYMALAVGLAALTVFAAPAAADHFEPGSSKVCGALSGGQVNCTLTIAISDDNGPGVIGGESIFVTLAAGTTGATYDSASLAGGTCAVGAAAGVVVNPSDLELMPDSAVDIDDCTIIVDEVLNADSAGEVCQTLDTAGNAPVLSFCDEIEPDPVDVAFDALLAAVTGVGPGHSLADKVALAKGSFDADDTASACSTLNAFIHEVNAQTGKKLTAGQAASFIAQAEAIEVLLDC
jgi:hypothetical protein